MFLTTIMKGRGDAEIHSVFNIEKSSKLRTFETAEEV
jgi:hypothetical protein